MQCSPLVRHVLHDEALTRGLGDAEARVLVEWLVEWAELLDGEAETNEAAWSGLRIVCRRARGISRFITLWSQEGSRGSAAQLAAAERFAWPLPISDEDPTELMVRILEWEDRQILV